MSARAGKLLALAACALAALALAACGGGDEEDGTAGGGTTSAPQAQGGPGDPAGGPGSGRGGAAAGGGAEPEAPASEDEVDLRVRPGSIEGARVTETGVVQTVRPSERSRRTAQENTYGSIRSFGGETQGEEATNITFALVQYLDAKASGDWATACARLYSVLRENLEDSDNGESCPDTLGTLMKRVPQSVRAEQARIDVSSVRRGEGNRAFVIYKTPETLSADMPMYVEDGVWKVASIEAYVLEPGQAG